MAYEDCKYYEKLSELVETMDTSSDEFNIKADELLDEELSGAGADWLSIHYESAAERMLEVMAEGELDDNEACYLLKCAKAEIRIFRAHGFKWKADSIKSMLSEAMQEYVKEM